MQNVIQKIAVIGGGAAGFFGAITCAQENTNFEIQIFEQSKEVLSKVRISGGGRCNVTHACFEPKELTTYYPRGNRELLGPFYKFGPTDTVKWFESHRVKLKTESDGRMFPVSDTSETIVNCLIQTAQKSGITINTRSKVQSIKLPEKAGDPFELTINDTKIYVNKVLLATGSSPMIWRWLKTEGYDISEPVPSLFTFNIANKRLQALMGTSFTNVNIQLVNLGIKTSGPLLITHWGLSGPAILKASAWGAIQLAKCDYKFELLIDWVPTISSDDIKYLRQSIPKKKIKVNPQFGLSGRFWQYIIESSEIPEETNWASISNIQLSTIIMQLKNSKFVVNGKSTFKEEFVTAGGVALKQINFNNFESKLHPGLFMAGEILDIDAVTGGFNFQAAWTGGYIAGKSMGTSI